MSIIKAQNDVVSTQCCIYDKKGSVCGCEETEYNQKKIEFQKKLPHTRRCTENVDNDGKEGGKEAEKSKNGDGQQKS